MTALERSDSLAMAMAAQGRLLTAWLLILFGVTEQLVSRAAAEGFTHFPG
jgi:hypothetical protein